MHLLGQAELEEELLDERWYTSSRIRTKSPIAFLTGRIEARIRLPQGQGLWPAFWMLPANTSRAVWAATGEIDIVEASALYRDVMYTPDYLGFLGQLMVWFHKRAERIFLLH